MLTLLSNLVQYYFYRGQLMDAGSRWERDGPTILVSFAAVLMMVHPTVFLLRDLKLPMPACQNKVGLYMLFASTHVGFVCLLSGTLLAVSSQFRESEAAARCPL
mmetsp:Transcript_50752/g.147800  ORF Transcript_50752/g.147800 Transcript_50752/m.147800 type:complete len:104 (+) Transcript_50752:335-646(+)|eukprot:CAMPEP_0170248756 /NCGR_PEP_ID=MMETSP0116_2-20130129/24175_1 /TAXON_ID=400756 /ORGANISM="Durinskia baltica, Strain CSIRO CS-38" /LENGTH=103 /DNA_ID=CAMNT_0010499653 /DNA_START=207 /DNA_END=518 /DNA_ORIENTATION=-